MRLVRKITGRFFFAHVNAKNLNRKNPEINHIRRTWTMSDSKKFFELVSRDESVKAELERASLAAFEALLIKKGLNISFAAGINSLRNR